MGQFVYRYNAVRKKIYKGVKTVTSGENSAGLCELNAVDPIA
jgi:hypothetical protein